jgi:hypothetical protein
VLRNPLLHMFIYNYFFIAIAVAWACLPA